MKACTNLPAKPASVLLVLFALAYANAGFSQTRSDTIYFNKYWDISEPYIASYYRVCTLNREKEIFYKGPIKEYTVTDSVVMIGNYNDRGLKDGDFKFYYPNGKIEKEGLFSADEMKGVWSYYKEDGSLYFQMKCLDNYHSIPILIIDLKGDTILKNSDGSFKINTLHYPKVFPNSRTPYVIDGTCSNGMLNGTWNYYLFDPPDDKLLSFSEEYENNQFKKAFQYSLLEGKEKVKQPGQLVNTVPKKLIAQDLFEAEWIFGVGKDNRSLPDYLLYHNTPLIAAGATSFNDNLNVFAKVFNHVLTSRVLHLDNKDYSTSNISTDKTIDGNRLKIKSIKEPTIVLKKDTAADADFIRGLRIQMQFSITEAGFLSDVEASGNIDRDDLLKLVYYFSRISGVQQPEKKEDVKEVHLFLYTKRSIDYGSGSPAKLTDLYLSYADPGSF